MGASYKRFPKYGICSLGESWRYCDTINSRHSVTRDPDCSCVCLTDLSANAFDFGVVWKPARYRRLALCCSIKGLLVLVGTSWAMHVVS